MFEAMAFDGFFPDVEGVVTGTYNGRHKGLKKDELVKKYVNMILSIDATFESEWTLISSGWKVLGLSELKINSNLVSVFKSL